MRMSCTINASTGFNGWFIIFIRSGSMDFFSKLLNKSGRVTCHGGVCELPKPKESKPLNNIKSRVLLLVKWFGGNNA
ncbi:hypothetical protein Syun_026958 [Stephania yunnanensis]|uniref:Uncharacterized protein n=1 Tax=Stephania yunnanensis TaxID=152371 RepID=A0AAP0EI13_9MAGN